MGLRDTWKNDQVRWAAEAMLGELDRLDDRGLARFREARPKVLEYRLVAPVTSVFINPFGPGRPFAKLIATNDLCSRTCFWDTSREPLTYHRPAA